MVAAPRLPGSGAIHLIFSLPALLIVCALLAGTAQAPVAKAVATANTQDLSPTERQRRVSKLVSNVIERSHYRQSPINDPVSSLVLDRFIEQLDGGRSYFLACDIAEFERFRYQLDDAVVGGQLEPVFAIFNRFQVRNRERVNHAVALLKSEPDFSVDEAFEFDRAKAPWAKSNEELNEIWRRRVKNDAVSLMLTEKTWPETRDILQKRYERVRQAHRTGHQRRHLRSVHELVRPCLRSALQLFLAAQLRGIPHPDEPFV